MKTCPYCHKDLPDDSTFCTYCGKPLTLVAKEERKVKEEKINLKKNPRTNSLGKLSLMVFFICLILLDFVLATVLASLNIAIKPVFIVSMVGYILAIACGVFSLVIDHQDKKNGYEPSGNKYYAYVAIVLSLNISLVNLTNVILK